VSRDASRAGREIRRGALDIIITPVNGLLSCKIRKIAHAADKANRRRQVSTVTFRGENKLKLAKMIMSQKARTPRKGVGIRFSDSTNSKNRTLARSSLTCIARDCSEALEIVLR
jgi:hypothetical protein